MERGRRMGLFFLKIILVILIYLLLIYVCHLGISRWLGVGRRKLFAHDIINEHHEKADKFTRTFMLAALLIGFILNIIYDFSSSRWYLQPYLYLIILLIFSQLVKAYMERKYIKDNREFTYTLFETGFTAILLVLLVTTGYWLLP
jgi:heme/copper-type cytochrome/quinol oxidase subunit 4